MFSLFYFMYLGFYALYKYIRTKPVANQTPIFAMDQVQTDDAIKNAVRKAFEEQKQAMKARALKAHANNCVDMWTCKKDPCFVVTPDKIVKTKTVKRKTDQQRIKEELKRRKEREERNKLPLN
jgi:hypothetical protein